jgi:hypothetical protein
VAEDRLQRAEWTREAREPARAAGNSHGPTEPVEALTWFWRGTYGGVRPGWEGAIVSNSQDTRECPYCKEEIKADAVLCRYCHSRLEPEGPTHGGKCPYCKEEIHPEALRCKHCQSDLMHGEHKRDGCGCDEGRGARRPFDQYGTPVRMVYEGLPTSTPRSAVRQPSGASVQYMRSLGARGPSGDSFFGDLTRRPWNCWMDTCCTEVGTCCLPTTLGWVCRACCIKEEPCEKCVWPTF